MDLAQKLLSCLCCTAEGQSNTTTASQHFATSEKLPLIVSQSPEPAERLFPPRVSYDIKYNSSDDLENEDQELAAQRILEILMTADHVDEHALRAQLPGTIGTVGWGDWIARRVLDGIVKLIRRIQQQQIQQQSRKYCALRAQSGNQYDKEEDLLEKAGNAFRTAYVSATKIANDIFGTLARQARNHPLETAAVVISMVLAIGVLVALAPYLLEVLGFAGEGVVEGKYNIFLYYD